MKKIYTSPILLLIGLLLSINSFGQLIAVNDTMPPVNGAIGNPNVGNVLNDNGNGVDTLNGNPVTINQVNVSTITPAIPITPGALVPYVNISTGNVSVPSNTPAGTYTITYSICEIANPTNCSTAIVIFTVNASVIYAMNDVFTINGYNGNSNYGNVLTNDTFNGTTPLISEVNLTSIEPFMPLGPGLPVPVFNWNNGTITVLPGTPIGTYTTHYVICEKLNPTNCNDATLTVNIVDNNSLFDGVGVFLFGANRPKTGSYYNNWIYLINYGTQVIPNGTVTFTKDLSLNMINVYPSTGITTTSDGFTYDYTNLLPGETRYLKVSMTIPPIPTVNIGQQINNSVAITPLDSYPSDNISTLTDTIVGAYDPNDKSENHDGKIVYSSFTSNDYLTYTIRFENTGTANATNIRVEDLLDVKLDETSLRMIASSSNCLLTRNNNKIIWLLNNINLPPSVPNPQTGHGYITFQIKPKPGYAIGDIIPNQANIYFDFNPAIVTNVCNTQFVSTLANDGFAFSGFKFFPNPVKNSLTISNPNTIDAVEITSILGQKMIVKTVNDLQTELDLSPLSNGVYFVKVTSEGQEKTVKIVKE